MPTQRSIYLLVALMSVALLVLMGVQYVLLSSAVKAKTEEFNRQVLAAMRASATAAQDKQSLRLLSLRLKKDTLAAARWMNADSGFFKFIEDAGAGEEIVTHNVTENMEVIVRQNKKGIQQKIIIRNGSQPETNLPEPPLPPLPALPPDAKKQELLSVMCKAADEYASVNLQWNQLIDSGAFKKILSRQFAQFGLPAKYYYCITDAASDTIVSTNAAGRKPSQYTYRTQLAGLQFSEKGLWLMVDFPGRFQYLAKALGGIFVLALLFSAIIVAVFVLALRLIFRQKKLHEISNDFINNMTHEFKTPLATLSMTADTLAIPSVSGNSEQVREYAAMIKQETGRLSQHVDRILQAADTEQKHKHQPAGKANIVQAVNRQLLHFGNTFAQTHTQLATQIPAHALHVEAEEEELGFVIANLLDNAVKYAGKLPRITVAINTTGNKVLLTIADRGIGISKADLEMVFEKFFRAHTGNRHDVKGFGLGLNYVKNTVESWGGKVWAESEPGKGSTFFVELNAAVNG